MKYTLRSMIAFCLVSSVAHAGDFDLEKIANEFIAKNPKVAEIVGVNALNIDMRLGPKSTLKLVDEEITESPAVDYVKVTLEGVGVETIHLTLKGPHGFYQKKDRLAQTVFVVSGFFTGRDTVKVINNFEQAVVIGYEYPHSIDEIKKKPELLYHTIRLTSAQIAASIQWVAEREFVNPYKKNAIGVSLGGIFLPSALAILQGLNEPMQGAIFAFTGTNVSQVAAQAFSKEINDPKIQDLLKNLAAALSLLHNPTIYLPYLKCETLFIRGDSDSVFPESSWKPFYDQMPPSKSIEVLSGGHINVDQPQLIDQTQSVIKKWLRL